MSSEREGKKSQDNAVKKVAGLDLDKSCGLVSEFSFWNTTNIAREREGEKREIGIVLKKSYFEPLSNKGRDHGA